MNNTNSFQCQSTVEVKASLLKLNIKLFSENQVNKWKSLNSTELVSNLILHLTLWGPKVSNLENAYVSVATSLNDLFD